MDKERKELMRAMRAAAVPGRRGPPAGYLGTQSTELNVTVPQLRKLARDWVRANADTPGADVLKLCDALFAGKTHQEKVLAAIVLSCHAKACASVSTRRVDAWLDHLHGWAEVDSLCSNVLKAEQMLGDWARWKALLTGLARDDNINKRRAALVLLTGPVRYSDDARLSEMAFAQVDRLKAERDIRITKAVSWLLRNLTIHHKAAVARFLKENADSLPPIAVRETTMKLRTGTKSRRSAKRA